jgi:cell division transport system permease protein
MRGLLRVELDLPLVDTAPSLLLGWIAALCVFLAVLGVAVAASASAGAHRSALEPRLFTLLLPVLDGRGPGNDEAERAVAALAAVEGVAFARTVTPAELGLAAPVAPAVESGAGPPLPRFIDFALNPGAAVDPQDLENRLSELVPGARVVAGDALKGAADAATVRAAALAGALAALLGLALAAAVVTRVSLAFQRDAIDLLRQLGARDAYLVRQLEHHALAQGLRGGVLGFLAAMLALAVATGPLRGIVPVVSLALPDWLLLGLVPVAAALLGALAAGLAARVRFRRSI